MKSGFWQIQIHPKDRYKTTFTVSFGQYECNVMLFGLYIYIYIVCVFYQDFGRVSFINRKFQVINLSNLHFYTTSKPRSSILDRHPHQPFIN
jgi:hypothetical protein